MNSDWSDFLNLLSFRDQIGWWSAYVDGHLVNVLFYSVLYHMRFCICNQKIISRCFNFESETNILSCDLFNAHARVNKKVK